MRKREGEEKYMQNFAETPEKKLERPRYRKEEYITLDLKEIFSCHGLASSCSG